MARGLDLRTLHDQLPAQIERLHACSADPRIAADGSKLVIEIDASEFVATLSAWSNGCVDIDLLRRGESSGVAWHREFANTRSALEALMDVLARLPALPGDCN